MRSFSVPRPRVLAGLLGLSAMLSMSPGLADQRPAAQAPAPSHGKAASRLLIRNAMVIYGNAKPAFGPVDILVQDGLIARVGPLSPKDPPPDAVIDATGKYVMPGIVNAHMHLQDERGGVAQPFQYEANLLLACGITTVRDVGSDLEKARKWREESAAHRLVAPRILIYTPSWRARGGPPADGRPGETATTVRAGVRWARENGADGIKIFGIDRDLLEAVLDESKRLGMRTAAHIAVEETTAKDFAELGVTSIEHFYGIADAALDGIQDFPPEHNASNEVHRFGRAGELYIQKNLNPAKLDETLDLMVAKGVAWVPTLSIYVASRDVLRAQNLPWYKEYLHPTMEEYLEAGPRQAWVVLPRVDEHPGGALEEVLPGVDGRPATFRAEGRPRRGRRRCRVHLLALRVRLDPGAGAAGGGGLPPARGDRAGDAERRARPRDGGPPRPRAGRVRRGPARGER